MAGKSRASYGFYEVYSKDKNIYQFDHLHSRILDYPCKSQPLHIDSRICGVYPPTSLHFFIYLSDVIFSVVSYILLFRSNYFL